MFTFLFPPTLTPSLFSSRPMRSRAPLWRLISAIRRSLLKPSGMFQTTAWARHSGVAFPWTPDLEKFGILAQVLQNYQNVPKPQSYLASVFIVACYTLVSPHLHVPSFSQHFSYSLYLTSRGTCPISSLLWGSLGKDTVFLSLAQQSAWLLPESLRETERPNRDRFSLTSPVGLWKRTVSTWPKRWHFLNGKIGLQGSIAQRWPFEV